MAKLICKACRYKLDKMPDSELCPYCGKKELEEEQNADELIHEVEKILE